MSAEHAIEPKAIAEDAMTARAAAQAPVAVMILSYGRVVPFIAMALIVVSGSPAAASVLTAEIGYGAVLLSFLGGSRWGIAIKSSGAALHFKPLSLCILPTFFSWITLLMSPAVALTALMAGFLLVALADRQSAREGRTPGWQSELDLPLTILTELALGASLAATLLFGS